MVRDAENAGRALDMFRSRHSTEGRFQSYCRGRSRHFLLRQLLTLFCFAVFVHVGEVTSAIVAAIVAIGADGLDSLVLSRLARRRLSAERLPLLMGVTALLGALQALSIGFFVALLVTAGGEDARSFAVAVCLAALLDSALLSRLHRAAAVARVAIHATSLVAIFLWVGEGGLPGNQGMFFDLMAALLTAYIFVVFLRHVHKARARAEARQEESLAAARELADMNAALEESRLTAQRLAMVAEQVSESIIITSPTGEITWVNRAFSNLLGYSTAEVVGQHVSLINGPATDPKAVDVLMTARREKRQARTEIINHHKDGTPIWMETSLTPVTDAAGDLVAVISVERDIGHLKAREEALAQANRTKQAFLTTVSHELRTPLNGILGNAEMLAESGLSSEQRAMALTIGESGTALLNIVNDILDMSALDAGRLAITRAPFDLPACLASVSNLMRPLAERKGLAFRLSITDDGLPQLEGDAGRLRQVLANLVGNAIKFTERGSVSLEATWQIDENVPHPGSKPHAQAPPVSVRIVVSDTGIGIKADKLDAIFESFAQANAQIAGRYGGTGLGLSISRQLIETMGGTLTARSTPGQGSQFCIDLRLSAVQTAPMAVQTLGAAPPPTHHAVPDLSGRRLLLADDNATNLRLLRAMLRKTGANVICATSGDEAVTLFQADPPNLVLMDMQMPGLDGAEATLAMRLHEATHNLAPLPIIALTANATEATRAKCEGAGMSGFLTKPLRQADLFRTLAEALVEGGEVPPARRASA